MPFNNPLIQRFPALTLRPAALGQWPTPIERLPLAEGLWCKREDQSGSLYGGNKVRKLRWILPEVPEGATLLSMGAAGSNHLVACGVYCREAGIPLESVLVPQPETAHVRANLRRIHGLSRRCWPAKSDAGAAMAIAQALRANHQEGRPVYPVWIGGSTPLGCLGWVEGALEIAAQVEAGVMPSPTDLFVAAGSGGTSAGLLLGLTMAGLDCRVHAVRVTAKWFSGKHVILAMARRAAALLRRHGARAPAPDARRLQVHAEVFAPGYGRGNPPTEAALREAADVGLTLEGTYTGKALAACLSDVREGRVGPSVLFIDTVSSIAPEPPLDALPPKVERLLQRLR